MTVRLPSNLMKVSNILTSTWLEEFVEWMKTKKLLRPLKSTIENCMLPEVRIAAGLGKIPDKNLNNRIKS